MSELPPDIKQSLTEFPRAAAESWQLLRQYRQIVKQAPRGNGEPVLCISGYGGNDSSMFPLRRFLSSVGYIPLKADMGVNFEAKEDRIKSVDDATAFRNKMVAILQERVLAIYKEYNQPVTLIGWSMGGLFAADLSQVMPDKIRMVITLGSPFGDPRGTATFKLFRTLNRSNIPIEDQDFDSWLDKRQLVSGHVPVKVLYSPLDGIVSVPTAKLLDHEAVEHIEVESSHIGFALNPVAYKIIAEQLVSA